MNTSEMLRTTRLRAAAMITTALIAGTGACSSSETADKSDNAAATNAADTATDKTANADKAADAGGEITTPGADWSAIDPETAGFDPAKLDALADKAKTQSSNCLYVTKNGKRVAEYYFNGTKPGSAQEVWSATKSVSSTIVGIAADEKLLTIDDPASKYIPKWSTGDPAKITIKDLLSNDSGRHYDYETDYLKMAAGAADKNAFAIDLAQDAAPGTVWAYNNSAIQTLSEVLEKTVPEDPVEFASERLLDPIGMADSKMTTDPSGNMLTFMGLQSSCRDMARFGLLFLNEGKWGDEQVISKSWVHEATQPSQDLNRSYGYLWWLNTASDADSGAGQATGSDETRPKGQMVPGAPDDVYFALGLGNQIVAVIPSEGIVAVRLGQGLTSKFSAADLTLGVLGAVR